MVELVVPLTITVLVVQNAQGFAVLRAAGHNPPVNAVTVACGVGSLIAALVGAVSTCLTGPTNAIITAMVAMAMGTTVATGDARVAIGAVMFFVSDLSVARDKFVAPGFGNRAWGLPLY